ncbi:MAG: hypothetical protein ACHQNE_01700 [Candidatus Kapaibacterium sp.]
MSLRGKSNDRREFDLTKQSVEIHLSLNGLLRRTFLASLRMFSSQ